MSAVISGILLPHVASTHAGYLPSRPRDLPPDRDAAATGIVDEAGL